MQISGKTTDDKVEFQVEGSIVYRTEAYRGPGPEPIEHTRHFVLARRGQQWKIRSTNLREDNVAGGVEYEEMGCDGAIIYELISFDEKNRTIAGAKDIITAQARVRPGDSPVAFGLDFFYPLWIAYCSAGYLASRSHNKIAAPLFTIRNFFTEPIPHTLSLPAKWKLNDSSFITEITWQSEGEYLHEEDRGSWLEKYPPPFDVGFLHASFKTTDWLSFSEMRLPGGFVLKVFAPHWPETGEPKCVDSFGVQAKVQAIHPLTTFSFLPELAKKTRITDTRYRLSTSCGSCPTYASLTWMTADEVEAKCDSMGIQYERQTSQN